MCSECLSIPCHPSCPNALEEEPVYICDLCGLGIYEGGKYIETAKGKICKECLDEMSSNELLEIFGEKFFIAIKEGR